MAVSIWNHVKGFSPQETWGNPIKMSGLLLLAMSAIRGEYIFNVDPYARFIIHCGYEITGHSDKSQHPLGNANDFHIISGLSYDKQIGKLLRILEGLQFATRVGFGIYPQWHNPGFHLDIRGNFARWGLVDDKYVEFSIAYSYAIKTTCGGVTNGC